MVNTERQSRTEVLMQIFIFAFFCSWERNDKKNYLENTAPQWQIFAKKNRIFYVIFRFHKLLLLRRLFFYPTLCFACFFLAVLGIYKVRNILSLGMVWWSWCIVRIGRL